MIVIHQSGPQSQIVCSTNFSSQYYLFILGLPRSSWVWSYPVASGWRPGCCPPLCTNHLTPCPRCRQTRHEALGGVRSRGLCLPHGRQVPILSRVVTNPLPAGQVPAHAAPHLGTERYVPAGMPPATHTSATTRVSGCHPAPTAGSDPAGGTPGTWGTGGAESGRTRATRGKLQGTAGAAGQALTCTCPGGCRSRCRWAQPAGAPSSVSSTCLLRAG